MYTHTHSVIQTGRSFAKKRLRLTNIHLKPIINMNVKFIDNEKKKRKEKAGALFKFRHQYLGQFPCLTDMRSVTEFCVVEHVFSALLLQGLSDPQQVFPTQ